MQSPLCIVMNRDSVAVNIADGFKATYLSLTDKVINPLTARLHQEIVIRLCPQINRRLSKLVSNDGHCRIGLRERRSQPFVVTPEHLAIIKVQFMAEAMPPAVAEAVLVFNAAGGVDALPEKGKKTRQSRIRQGQKLFAGSE